MSVYSEQNSANSAVTQKIQNFYQGQALYNLDLTEIFGSFVTLRELLVSKLAITKGISSNTAYHY